MAKSRDTRENRIDNTRQTTMRLFEDRDRERDIVIAEVGRTTPQNGLWGSSLLLPSYTSQLFVTSPTARRITPVPPNAPIKSRKSFSKAGLKPKKLRFTDKERDEAEGENCSQKRANYSIKVSKQKTELSKQQNKSKERLDRESLSTVLQSIRLELDNKENRRYGQERYERRAKNSRFATKERTKNNNNSSSQLSKSNCNPKGFEKFPISKMPNIKEVEEDLVENEYNAGSLVWSRVDGYPWWPAIVDDCPETLRSYKLQESSIIPVKYHVTFFDDTLQHAWINRKNIKAFIKYKKDRLVKRSKFHGTDYKKSLEEAYVLAQSAIPLSIFERLQRFSYISRLRNMQEFVI